VPWADAVEQAAALKTRTAMPFLTVIIRESG
jgi:hypothetical protein